MTLSGEGEYNLNILKEISVTDSFLELDSDVTKCQNYNFEVSYDKCTTRSFSEEMRINCGCLPFFISNATINKDRVCKFFSCGRSSSISYNKLQALSVHLSLYQ